jgi:hypothetical protein
MTEGKSAIVEYAKGIDSTFSPTEQMQVIQQSAINRTLESLRGAGVQQEVIRPAEQLLSQNIATGGSKEQLRERLITHVRGRQDNLGEIERYSKQITQDALNQYNRQYLQGASENLRLEFYLYEGGTKPTSRPFCQKRAGNYYHIKEIKSWVSLSWAGKIPTTTEGTILTYLGGYNCRHIPIPVSRAAVPESVIDRAKNEGYIK